MRDSPLAGTLAARLGDFQAGGESLRLERPMAADRIECIWALSAARGRLDFNDDEMGAVVSMFLAESSRLQCGGAVNV